MLTTIVCAALSAVGLAVAFLTAYRRRFIAATRIAALALVPVGLALAGLVGLVGRIVAAVGAWAGDLVLRPTVYSGFAVLALSVVLYAIARVASRHRPARRRRPAAPRAGEGERPAAPAGDAPAFGAGAREKSQATGTASGEKPSGEKPASGAGLDDFSDIEEILKKHGI
jgi:hypothetical protein